MLLRNKDDMKHLLGEFAFMALMVHYGSSVSTCVRHCNMFRDHHSLLEVDQRHLPEGMHSLE